MCLGVFKKYLLFELFFWKCNILFMVVSFIHVIDPNKRSPASGESCEEKDEVKAAAREDCKSQSKGKRKRERQRQRNQKEPGSQQKIQLLCG